jgi:hypothetical protein
MKIKAIQIHDLKTEYFILSFCSIPRQSVFTHNSSGLLTKDSCTILYVTMVGLKSSS